MNPDDDRNANRRGRRRRNEREDTPSNEEVENDLAMRRQPGRRAKKPKKIERIEKIVNPIGVRRVNGQFRPMDLPSCPQEMLASVLKYITFETVTRIRKINKQMDYVAVKYKCNLPKVDTVYVVCYGKSDAQLSISYSEKDLRDNYEHDYDPRHLLVSFANNQNGILNEIEEVVKKIRSPRTLWLGEGEIDQEMLDLLQKPRILKMSLCLKSCNFCVSLEKLIVVLAKHQDSRMWIDPANKIKNEPIGTDAVLIPLLPYVEVRFIGGTRDIPRCPALTDETLRAARQCLPHTFRVGWECPFSFAEVKKTMVCLIECFERKEKKISQWTFGHLQMPSEEEMQKTIDDLLTIPGTRIESQWKQYANITYNGETPNRYLFEVRLELIDGRF